MRKNGLLAAAYMADLARKGATGVQGYCLRTCRLAWGLGSDEGSAIAEWDSIPGRFKHTDPNAAPVGAPHFWTGSKGALKRYGHVAIQAEHEGYVWSTDAPATNKVGLVDILWFKKHWNAVYLGWSSQFQNTVLPLGAEAPKE